MESFDFSAFLQNHEKKHKTRPTQFVSVAGGVRKRLENNIKRRRSSRLTIFDSIRNLSSVDSPKKQPDPLTKVEHRRMQLEKWKEEKQIKKQQAAAQKKKPFVAGVAHNPLKYMPPPPPKVLPSSSGRVTRSQTAKNVIKPKSEKATVKQAKVQSFAPKNAKFTAPEIKNLTKVPTLAPLTKLKKNKETLTFEPVLASTIPKPAPKTQSKIIKTTAKGKATSQVEKRTTRGRPAKAVSSSSFRSQESSGEAQSPPRNPTQSLNEETESSSLEQDITNTIRKSIQTPSEVMMSPAGKKQSRKSKTPRKLTKILTPVKPIPKSESSSEEKLRSPKSPVDPRTPEQIVEEAKNSPFVTVSRGKANARRETMKKIDEGLLDEDASNAESVEHFKRQLNSEINRMTEMCITWEKISEQVVLPENVHELVLGAVGQARLLMSRKLRQFAALVARCERPDPAAPLVTPADLHGFWDMVFMQVENVDLRFRKLEQLRARGWAEETPPARRRAAAPRPRPPARQQPAPASRLKDLIAAARKAKKQEQEQTGQPAEAPDRTFEAGFFCVRSPQRPPKSTPTPTPTTTPTPSLLKAVLSSEAKKSANMSLTSLAMLRASFISKDVETSSPEVESNAQLPAINFDATPSRSILKPLNTASIKKSGKKSIKVVLFEDSDNESLETSQKDNKSEGVNGMHKLEEDSTNIVASEDVDKAIPEKENISKRKSLTRQNAIENHSPVMTRSRRKSMPTPAVTVSEDDVAEKTPKRSTRRKKALQEIDANTPHRRSSRRKSALVL